MPEKGKVPSMILIGLIFLSLSLAGGAFYFFQQEKVKSVTLEEELDDVRVKTKIVEKKLKDSQTQAAQLEVQLRESRSQIEFLNNEVTKNKAEREEAVSNLSKLREEIKKEADSRAALEQELNQSQQKIKDLEAQFADLENEKVALEDKISEIEAVASERVELGTIFVAQEETPRASVVEPVLAAVPASNTAVPRANLEGKVLVVNKDYNFGVISLGSKDGVSVGDIFSIYRKNKYIGDMKVEKVHESMSAANFLSSEIKKSAREGDKVALKTR